MYVSKRAEKNWKKNFIAPAEIRTRDLWIMSPTPYQLRHATRQQIRANYKRPPELPDMVLTELSAFKSSTYLYAYFYKHYALFETNFRVL